MDAILVVLEDAVLRRLDVSWACQAEEEGFLAGFVRVGAVPGRFRVASKEVASSTSGHHHCGALAVALLVAALHAEAIPRRTKQELESDLTVRACVVQKSASKTTA